ncbi:MAG: hypothetical protein DME10_12885 [Candidatus Rokuibacteriota bacterium]|nr:MAG: hypothetical protein DME10_12885 [Candidatus Rokubacteria bacterium]
MSDKVVRYEAQDGVALITLDRPDVLNAMNTQMRTELFEIFTRLRMDESVKVVVVTGGGDRAFSAGADIREFLEPPTPTHFRESRRRLDFRSESGLEFALACDIRVAAEDAQLGLTEINLAIIPGGGGTQRLPRLVGRGKALEMILTGMRVPAAEALRIGLVERVVPVSELMPAAQGLARDIAAKAPIALRYAKEAVVSGLGLPLQDGIRLENDLATLLRTTEDRVEGARAFVEKRKPKWSGR